MIHPSATDILRNVDATIVAKVEPGLRDLDSRSAVATIRHLLRLVRVRIEEEGEILTADIAALRELLPQILRYFRSIGAETEADSIETVLAAGATATGYRNLDQLGDATGQLREAVYLALKHLLSLRDSLEQTEAYQDIRGKIRTYVVWQNEQEHKLIAPAFFDQGPRR